MNNKSIKDRQAASDRSKGLLVAIAASLVLLVLAAYKVPLFQNEVYGTIIGVSEIHNEKGSKLIAAVQLDTGPKVLASMPMDLLKRHDTRVKINEERSLLGRKSYKIITYGE
jgi:hypothetical protein